MRVRLGMTGVAVAAMVGLATACSNGSTIGGSAAGSSTGGGLTGQNSAPSSSPTPFTGKLLQPGEVAQVASTSGARMRPVSDGMIRSFGTTVKIVEVGTADTVDDASTGESYRAAAGASLLAFTVTVGQDEGMDGIGDKVVADVNVDGTQRTLPEFFGDSGDSGDSGDFGDSGDSGGSGSAGGTQVHYVLATAQNKQTVDLELKASNVVQSFDLLQGKPKGDRPAALYRSTSGTTVHQEGISPVTYKVAVYDKDEAHQVTVTKAELGYFTAKDASVPSNPANGWLVLNVTDRSDGYATCVTPASAYTLKDAAGKEYRPSDAATSVPSEPGFVSDTQSVVAFEVPADFAQGTVTIAPSTAVCEKGTMNFVPRPVHSTATVSISLPTA